MNKLIKKRCIKKSFKTFHMFSNRISYFLAERCQRIPYFVFTMSCVNPASACEFYSNHVVPQHYIPYDEIQVVLFFAALQIT